jgi:hypothetical protein
MPIFQRFMLPASSGFDETWHCVSQVGDGKDRLQIQRIAVNILNKQLQTADQK